MILQDALCDLADRLLNTGYFFKFYEYVEIIPLQGVDRAMYYTSGSDLVDVHDFDRNGSGYIRKRGQVTFEGVSENFQTVACYNTDPVLNIRFPLRLVGAVPKSKLADNGYSDDLLAMELFPVLNSAMTAPSGVTKLQGVVGRYESSRVRVWEEEVSNLADRIMNLELSYIYIDFDLIFTAKASCLSEPCY